MLTWRVFAEVFAETVTCVYILGENIMLHDMFTSITKDVGM